jgi:hypothetical protein
MILKGDHHITIPVLVSIKLMGSVISEENIFKYFFVKISEKYYAS